MTMYKNGVSFTESISFSNVFQKLNCSICFQANYPVDNHKGDDESWVDLVRNKEGTVQFVFVDRFGLPKRELTENSINILFMFAFHTSSSEHLVEHVH